jgi:hypothetical protein
MSSPLESELAQSNMDWSKYVFIKCKVCQGVYRFGIYGFRAGYVLCPSCGAYDWNPKLVGKEEYRAFLNRIKTPYNLQRRQMRLWNPQEVE